MSPLLRVNGAGLLMSTYSSFSDRTILSFKMSSLIIIKRKTVYEDIQHACMKYTLIQASHELVKFLVLSNKCSTTIMHKEMYVFNQGSTE